MKSYKETKQQVWESLSDEYPTSLLKLLFTNPLTIFAVVDIAWNGWRNSDD